MKRKTRRKSAGGYGVPPKHAQFKPGQSGNPRGRPKGARNLSTELKEAFEAKVLVTVNGRKRKVSTRMAAVMRLVEKALQGDARAMERFFKLAQDHEQQPAEQVSSNIDADDQAIIDAFRADILAEAAEKVATPSPPKPKES